MQPRRKKDNRCYTICNYYRTYLKQRLCTTHSNNYDELERVIIDTLKQECLNYIDKKKVKEKVLNSNEINTQNSYQNEINCLKNEIDKINANLDNFYMDKLNKVIDENMFNRVRLKFELDLSNKEKMYNELLNIINNKTSEILKQKELEKCVNQFLSMKEPNRELIVNLIEKIDIFENKDIDIKVTFYSIL